MKNWSEAPGNRRQTEENKQLHKENELLRAALAEIAEQHPITGMHTRRIRGIIDKVLLPPAEGGEG